MKALIFGTGGVGSVYGYILNRAGVEVTAVCRTNYDAVRERGILIRSRVFGRCEYHPTAVKSVAEASSHGPFDYIIVASKALPGTAELIKDAVTPGITAIALAQNGIAIEDDYARLYPSNTIISGVVYLPVTQVEPGVAEMGEFERYEIGTFPADASCKAKSQAARLAELWKAGGATATLAEDVQPLRWKKVTINGAWNAAAALSLCDDVNFILSSVRAEGTIRKMMREIGRVAAAAGYPGLITDDFIEEDLKRPKGRVHTGGKEPSMLVDVHHGRTMEVEAIVGNTLRIAERHHLDTPYLELLYTLATARNHELVKDETWRPIARSN